MLTPHHLDGRIRLEPWDFLKKGCLTRIPFLKMDKTKIYILHFIRMNHNIVNHPGCIDNGAQDADN